MKLNDSQLVILSGAAKRDDGSILPLPASMKLNGKAATPVLKSLLKRKLVAEEYAAAGEEAWREEADGLRFALSITVAGLEAVGVTKPTDATAADAGQVPAPVAPRADRGKKAAANVRQVRKAGKPRKTGPRDVGSKPASAAKKVKAAQPAASRGGTKLDQVQKLLSRKGGATIQQMMEATNWLPHTTRAVLTGFRKRGFDIQREAVKDKPTVYRIVGDKAAAAKRAGKTA